MNLNLDQKTVLITGGSSGIGYGIAKAFHGLGAKVTITGTRSAEAYENDISDFSFIQLNATNFDSVKELAEKFDHLDVLVNCVGTVLYKKQEFEREGFQKIINTNLTGVMDLCMAFLPLLEKSQGNIINLDSIVAIRAAPSNPAYCASKAGLVQLTKSLAMRWGRKGVRINSIAPGMVPTKLTANQSGPENEAQFALRNPIGRFGKPADIAGGAIFLASDLASYVTGHQLVIDGGYTL